MNVPPGEPYHDTERQSDAVAQPGHSGETEIDLQLRRISLKLTRTSAEIRAEGIAVANWWLAARRLRTNVFRPGLFSDPAWDILLDLYTAEERGERVKITSLIGATAIPHSTIIRWARIMTQEGLLVRQKDPRDGRRIYVRLSPEARDLMEAYFEMLGARATFPTSDLR